MKSRTICFLGSHSRPVRIGLPYHAARIDAKPLLTPSNATAYERRFLGVSYGQAGTLTRLYMYRLGSAAPSFVKLK